MPIWMYYVEWWWKKSKQWLRVRIYWMRYIAGQPTSTPLVLCCINSAKCWYFSFNVPITLFFRFFFSFMSLFLCFFVFFFFFPWTLILRFMKQFSWYWWLYLFWFCVFVAQTNSLNVHMTVCQLKQFFFLIR